MFGSQYLVLSIELKVIQETTQVKKNKFWQNEALSISKKKPTKIFCLFFPKKLQISQTTKNSRKVLSKYPVCNQGYQNAKVDLMGRKNDRIAWPIKIAIAKTLTKAKALNPVAIAKAKTSMTELNECAPFQQDSTSDLRHINVLDKYLTIRGFKEIH